MPADDRRQTHFVSPASSDPREAPVPLSVGAALAGRHVLITGATGFVGKVWLCQALEQLPEIGRLYVLIRGNRRPARERFERIVGTSPAFASLHERFGADLAAYLAQKVEILEGDISSPRLGLDDATLARLYARIDLVINSAGLVDFNPDVRDAIASNVDGVLEVLEFVRRCDHGRLLHVSTCYVAGLQQGYIRETVDWKKTPNGKPLEVEGEYEFLRGLVQSIVHEENSAAAVDRIRQVVLDRVQERGVKADATRVEAMVARLRRKQLVQRMTDGATAHAASLGWPNTYTYTKALGEGLLALRSGTVPFCIVRPSVVESAMRYPFPGWNEGFNTSGPMVYLTGTWLRHIPAKADNPFDVIPVDMLCNGMTIAAAALLTGQHQSVYHCGTSDRNLLDFARAVDLSALGQRQHLREHGKSRAQRLVLSRWDVVIADPEHVLNMNNLRRVVRQVSRFMTKGLPERVPSEVRDWADDIASSAEKADRRLQLIEEMLELFRPFTYDSRCIFQSHGLSRFAVEEPALRFEPEAIDWRHYWLQIHMPGLRRWCFPTYEGRDLETYQPKVPFRLLPERGAEEAQP